MRRLMVFSAIIGAAVLSCVTMSRGERLYRSRCTACHMMIPPSDYGEEMWAYALEKYGKHLTAEEKGDMMKFLTETGGTR